MINPRVWRVTAHSLDPSVSASKQANKRLSGRFFVSIYHSTYQSSVPLVRTGMDLIGRTSEPQKLLMSSHAHQENARGMRGDS